MVAQKTDCQRGTTGKTIKLITKMANKPTLVKDNDDSPCHENCCVNVTSNLLLGRLTLKMKALRSFQTSTTTHPTTVTPQKTGTFSSA
jgi:hypothetical protein